MSAVYSKTKTSDVAQLVMDLLDQRIEEGRKDGDEYKDARLAAKQDSCGDYLLFSHDGATFKIRFEKVK